MQNSLQYSDGRVEIVDVPKAFSVGDVVAVTHRRDGGVVVQRVTPLAVDTLPGIIRIYIGTVPALTYIGVKFYFKRYIPGGQSVNLYYAIEHGAGETGSNWYYNSTADWALRNSTGIARLPAQYDCTYKLQVLNLLPGDYFRVDLFVFSGTYLNGQDLPDGSFESGAFGDGATQWIKNAGGMVRIINTDAYSGSYCCEFYG